MASLEERLAALASMTAAQLGKEWQKLTGRTPPKVGRKLLALAVAHKIQERELGGPSQAIKNHLDRLCAQYARSGELATEPCAALKPGSRLVRNWHGEPHHVTICEDGYLYREQRYRSLSHIAREITGTNWSGPRFFGLTKPGDRSRG